MTNLENILEEACIALGDEWIYEHGSVSLYEWWKSRKQVLEVRKMEKVVNAAAAWINYLENKGGHYRDGIPGDLMDAIDDLDPTLIAMQGFKNVGI